MPRDVDKAKTRKALRTLKRVSRQAEQGPGLTDWERQFVDGVGERLETYGSAFRDPGKGRLEEALSERQAHVVRQLRKKARGPKTIAPNTETTGAEATSAETTRTDTTGGPRSRPASSGLKRRTPLRAKRPTPKGASGRPADEPGEGPETEPPARPRSASGARPALRIVGRGEPKT